VFYSYQRWLYTQTGRVASEEYDWLLEKGGMEYDSPLLDHKELYERRAPGSTCLSALKSAVHQNYGTVDHHINNSQGCGGIMRVAPAGLMFHDSPDQAFRVAADCAAITHGHPSGYLSAGVLAYIIAAVLNGESIQQAAESSLDTLGRYEGYEETLSFVEKALELADGYTEAHKAVALLGAGWVGEEALAIALYCALKHPNDFRKALCLSVNHSGDSDSTGAICGNILGAYLGMEGIPEEWVLRVELSDVIIRMAEELYSSRRA